MPPEDLRRSVDREAVSRLDVMEKNYHDLLLKFGQLDSSVTLLKVNQEHMKEFFDARLKTIEKSQDLQLVQLVELRKEIQTMADDPIKTPMGRMIRRDYNSVEASCAENQESIKKLHDWQNSINTVLYLLKWVGVTGFVAFILAVLRLFKVIP